MLVRLQSIWILLLLALTGCVTAPAGSPSSASGSPIYVTAANPHAAEAGMKILRRGGSAVDAAIAVQAMLSLVEPQSSGIGGGAFMTYYDSSARKVRVFDGRETAPAGASPDMFLDDQGAPLPFREAVIGGIATGVPGVVRMLDLAHREHGLLPWSQLFDDARRTASEGFIISPRLGRFIASNAPQNQTIDARAYFSAPDGRRLQAGDRLRNPPYAAFVERLAAQGPEALYSGETARRIVDRVQAGPLPGALTLEDLANYRPVEREALCRPWRAVIACVPPPPSSGVALLQWLLMLEQTDVKALGPADPRAWFLFAEASRLIYPDRDHYVGDPAFVPVPVDGLLDPDYIRSRAALIGEQGGRPASHGSPPGAAALAPDYTLEPAGTSHFVIGDSAGNVVSMTTTVESLFGSGRMVDGFFLNNQMTDFSFVPVDRSGRIAANAVRPGKRPRSSMSPVVLVTADGAFVGAIGSPGGNAILGYIAKTLLGSVDWGLTMQEAIDLPNLIARGNAYQGEVTRFSPEILAGLRRRGIELRPGQGEDSGLHGLIYHLGEPNIGADRRREGIVLIEKPD